ncbi:MAG: preprotein translocase subunit YajC [Candidatus Ratteibacteria bacterium]|nr:preprotein translocase subunit YajC [Candidatus Ratteibacteria bacterium]
MENLYAMASGTASGEGGLGGFSAFLPFIIILGIFYFLIVMPQHKKDQEHKKMLESLKRGDKIITNGGIYGRIVDIKENKFVIEIAKGVEIEILKGAVGNKAKE